MNEQNEAKKNFEKAIELFNSKNYLKAIKFFEKTLEIHPKNINILENTAIAYFRAGNFIGAENHLKKILSLDAKSKKAIPLLIFIYEKLNKQKEFSETIELGIKNGEISNHYEIIKNFFVPNFFENEEEIKKYRSKIFNFLEKIESDQLNFDLDINKQKIYPPIFKLSYDQFDNLELNKKIVKIYKKIYPDLNKKIILKEKNKDKIRIGFISEFFTNHTIMKLYKGIMLNLDENMFNIYIFHSHNTEKGRYLSEIQEAEITKKNLENIFLTNNLNKNLNIFEEKNLDILFYPDIHMSESLYFLTFFKLAKYQMTSWGHPMTTGNEKIDFFLSSKLMEKENAQKNYSEKLILSNYLPMFFYKPKVNNILDQEKLKIKNIYSCPQSLIKIHPQFDEVIKKILLEDNKAEILFIKDSNNILAKKIFERMKSKINNGIDRVKFIDRVPTEDFVHHCGSASVLLDPLFFGAGNSFHESMFYGTPTITMPTDYLKSNIVMGAYKQMKINNAPIVENIDEYVNKAVELANLDNGKMLEFKMFLKEKAEENLYENINFVKELEKIFLKILENKVK